MSHSRIAEPLKTCAIFMTIKHWYWWNCCIHVMHTLRLQTFLLPLRIRHALARQRTEEKTEFKFIFE